MEEHPRDCSFDCSLCGKCVRGRGRHRAFYPSASGASAQTLDDGTVTVLVLCHPCAARTVGRLSFEMTKEFYRRGKQLRSMFEELKAVERGNGGL